MVFTVVFFYTFILTTLFFIQLHIQATTEKPFGCRTVKFQQRIPSFSSSKVYSSCIEYLFREGAGLGQPLILDAGNKITGVGLRRQLPVVGLIETILDGNGNDSFSYTVENPTLFTYPVTWHRGKFTFEKCADGNTDLHWQVDFVPIKFCGPLAVSFTKLILGIYLNALSKHLGVPSTAICSA